MAPHSSTLAWKIHGWRSLVGCNPWGREESDVTERLHFHFLFSCTGEGNGNPLQCSCLENPRDGEAWWAAVYGVAQGRTRLKWLSSKPIQCAKWRVNHNAHYELWMSMVCQYKAVYWNVYHSSGGCWHWGRLFIFGGRGYITKSLFLPLWT